MRARITKHVLLHLGCLDDRFFHLLPTTMANLLNTTLALNGTNMTSAFEAHNEELAGKLAESISWVPMEVVRRTNASSS